MRLRSFGWTPERSSRGARREAPPGRARPGRARPRRAPRRALAGAARARPGPRAGIGPSRPPRSAAGPRRAANRSPRAPARRSGPPRTPRRGSAMPTSRCSSRSLLRGRGRAAQDLQPAIDLNRVAADGHRVLPALRAAARRAAIATPVFPAAVGPKMATTCIEPAQPTRLRIRSCPRSVCEVRLGDLDLDQVARLRRALEVDRLVVAAASAQAGRVGAAGALDQDVERAAHEALRALLRARLHEIHEALHALLLHRMRNLTVHRRRLGAAARREHEGEGAVVGDLIDDLERPLEVLVGLAREADDDVGGERAVRHVLADQRDAVEVALARVRAPHAPSGSGSIPTGAAGGCARTAPRTRRGPGSRPRACPWGAGSCSGCRSMPSIASTAAQELGERHPVVVRAGRARKRSRSGQAA